MFLLNVSDDQLRLKNREVGKALCDLVGVLEGSGSRGRTAGVAATPARLRWIKVPAAVLVKEDVVFLHRGGEDG